MENEKTIMELFDEIREEFHIAPDSDFGYRIFLSTMWFNFIQ